MVRKRLLILICLWLLPGTPFVWGQQFPHNINFESGDLRGWKKSGNAFVFQPTKGDNPTARHKRQPSSHQGKYWIGTYEKYQGKQGQKRGDVQGDRPTGTLTSAPFSIPSGTLSFLIGGGSGFKTRVELLVLDPLEGSVRMKYASGKNSETMQRIAWDLAPYAGKEGQIRIVDASSEGWGHINVDDFRFSAAHFIQPPITHFQPLEVIYTAAVPNVIGHSLYEAKTIIDAAHLEIAEAKRVISVKKPGTVVRQHPAAGTRVARDTVLKLWIAEKQEFPKPKAVIHPSMIRVIQGEPAVFKSRSEYDLDGLIIEQWSGPDQAGKGCVFEVCTRYLMPGEYKIVLDIVDSHMQEDRALAALYIKLPPVEYHLSLKAEPNRIEENQNTRLIASISPEAPDVRYRFDFGDGEKTGWISKSQIKYFYSSPGTYHASVETRINEKSIVKRVRIEVRPIEYSVGLEVDRQYIQVKEEVRFKGGILPASENVRYCFYYGDGEKSRWLEESAASHTYSRPDLQHAYLKAKVGEREFCSEKILIDVRKIEYSLQLEAEPSSVQPEEQITVNAILQPFAPEARYRFDFGDGETHIEGGGPGAVHIYRAPGAYDINVTVTIGQQSLSKTIRLTVQEQQPIVLPLWILIAAVGGALAVLGGGAYLYRRKPWKSEIENSTEVVVTIRTKEGQTNQEIDKESLQKDIEVRFRPVGDAGTQKIE